MKKLVLVAALSLPLLASAQNLLTNGSFELGLDGWTVSNSAGTRYPVGTITYGTLPGASGEIIPVDNALGSFSPDAAGTQAVYFLDDDTRQILTQSFQITEAGAYNLGFSYYVPFNGFANVGEASFSVQFLDQPTTLTVSSLTPGVWTAVNRIADLVPGMYTASFTFLTTGGVSKDLLLDRLYVSAVPEPSTYAMLLAGLGVMGLVAARRRRRTD